MLESKACSRYAVDPATSTLTFEAKSTLHAVRGRTDQLSGYVDAAWESDGSLALDPAPHMHVEFSVERLRSGNGLQDREMWRLIDSSRFPLIVADLRGLQPAARPGDYEGSGDITLAGRSRRYSGTLSVSRSHDGSSLTVDGSLTVDIRDFGLRPPNLLLVKVDPLVAVRLHLVAAVPA
jgi:hypothetical protein